MAGLAMGRGKVFGGACVILITATLLARLPFIGSSEDGTEMDVTEVSDWALRFGKSLAAGSSEVTSLGIIADNFVKLGATVKRVNAVQMIEDMRDDIKNILSWKRLAVERIAEVAEYEASRHQYDKNIKHEYYKSEVEKDDDNDEPKDVSNNTKPHRHHKSLKDLDLRPHRNFANAPVNFQESSVHVPTNVYDKEPHVLNAIKWSEYLTDAFRSNLKFDTSLNWQYFGSSSGFLRGFPATTWITEGKEKPDFYDCRTRPWYVQAASSAKDIVILVDGSGSMTGIRKEIAKNVVRDILNTLTEDDFVTILRFSDSTEPIVECFENSLVQANDENIRRFMNDMSQMKTENIANFTLGLSTAFELLQRYNKSDLGSQCNQAIMLITDGAPNTYQDVFKLYNDPDRCVRVFTYLIGIEVTEYREVNWMACHNRGLFTHVATLPEVRDQVQKHIPVMSRPIALSNVRPFIWTSVYADVPATELTVHEWKDREHERVRHALNDMRRRRYFHAKEDPDIEDPDTTPEPEREPREIRPLQLITTVATPVFDRRNAKIGTLLGVAGIDVPTREIIKHTKAYKIGVNAYAFAITNNGYILFHPELRVLYHDLLKPAYRNIELTEVELADMNSLLYELDETLLKIRKDMIDRKPGSRKMAVKVPMDNFKRVVTRNSSYYYGPIDDTPFTLGVSLPEPYGHYSVVGYAEVKNKSEVWMQYFAGNNWRLHPEWVYCEIPQEHDDGYSSAEDTLKHFLSELLTNQNFTWKTISERPPKFSKLTCEKDLIQSLLFDAKATFIDPLKEKDSEHEAIRMFGITSAFIATRSGLTRYEDYRPASEIDNSTESTIYDTHTKATEEEFYKRAVDFHYINSSAFVFSVPFNAGDQMSTLVTGSHALFLSNGTKKAPAAVVGLQFNHSVFAGNFFEATSECRTTPCRFKCDDEELDCYLLDNNGFVVVSENRDHTGNFFGEIDYAVFESMIENGIYKRVLVYDYQGVCLEEDLSRGFSPFLLTPFHHLRDIFNWFWSKLALFYMHLSLYELWSKDWAVSASDYDYDEFGPLKKTIPHPCETESYLYEMLPRDFTEPLKGRLPMCHSSGCDKQFIAQPVPYTNLVMLVVYTTCPCETTSVSIKPKEVTQNETLRCIRMRENMYRRRPSVCHGCHTKESEMNHECGGCSRLSVVTASILLVTYITSHILTRCFLLV